MRTSINDPGHQENQTHQPTSPLTTFANPSIFTMENSANFPRLPNARPMDPISGSEPPLKLYSWLHTMTRLFTAHGTPDEHRARYVGQHVTEEAATWYDSMQAANLTWEEFGNAFMARFLPRELETDLLRQFSCLTQAGYQLNQYITRFESLYSVLQANLSPLFARELFVNGLDSYLRPEVSAQGPVDLQAAFALARRVHMAKQTDGQVPARRPGEMPIEGPASNAPRPGIQSAARNPDAMDIDLNYTQPHRNNPNGDGHAGVRKCFYCKKPGHMIRECPRRLAKEQGNARAQ